MPKYLEVTMPNGEGWRIPARFIAEHRARYYAERDPDTTFDGEVAFLMENDDEVADWAANNMNWEDVAAVAVKVRDPEPVSLIRGWLDGDMRVVRDA